MSLAKIARKLKQFNPVIDDEFQELNRIIFDDYLVVDIKEVSPDNIEIFIHNLCDQEDNFGILKSYTEIINHLEFMLSQEAKELK